jgi:hypothetical protein
MGLEAVYSQTEQRTGRHLSGGRYFVLCIDIPTSKIPDHNLRVKRPVAEIPDQRQRYQTNLRDKRPVAEITDLPQSSN